MSPYPNTSSLLLVLVQPCWLLIYRVQECSNHSYLMGNIWALHTYQNVFLGNILAITVGLSIIRSSELSLNSTGGLSTVLGLYSYMCPLR